MIPDQHPDPVTEAVQVAVRDAAQLGALLSGMARVTMRHHARRARVKRAQEERTRKAAHARVQAEQAAARARWAPASNRRWLCGAGLADTAAAWCAAVPFTEPGSPWFDQAAETAARNCEDRFRDLHPHAMARYDRLRDDGLNRVEAMRAAAPLFARPSRVHDAGMRPAAALAAAGGDAGEAWSLKIHGPSREEFEVAMRERRDERGRRIAQRLRADGTLVTAEELRARLETSTNLPLDVIDGLLSRDAGFARAVGKARNGRQPWRDDFPFPVSALIAARAGTTANPPSQSAEARSSASPERIDGRDKVRRAARR